MENKKTIINYINEAWRIHSLSDLGLDQQNSTPMASSRVIEIAKMLQLEDHRKSNILTLTDLLITLIPDKEFKGEIKEDEPHYCGLKNCVICGH